MSTKKINLYSQWYVKLDKRSLSYVPVKAFLLFHVQGSPYEFFTSQANKKVQQVIEIWKSGLGVVSLHCFQSVIPVEAYTREACMIEAIGKIIIFYLFSFLKILFEFHLKYIMQNSLKNFLSPVTTLNLHSVD